MRTLRDVALYALLASLAACAHRVPGARTFDEACPAAWTFLYTDYSVGETNGAPRVVCRPPAAAEDSAGRPRATSSPF